VDAARVRVGKSFLTRWAGYVRGGGTPSLWHKRRIGRAQITKIIMVII
jgi:hypothetical protein